jgi:hypothetical protein
MEMTNEEFEEILEDAFEWGVSIVNGIYQGLKIIEKYIDINKEYLTDAEDGKVWSVNMSMLISAGITVEDIKELGRLGWSYSTNGGLCCYV